ncbi:hypothetical protein CAOG_00367 [Capsaspora owczarzaki ATCC 30864]|uniref:Uncharacterized protein n=1 Tax=Capsaspora owczarzaki (strain ATCC 30864) TaxID=595528 RepID=A0A0D2X0B7_CAPO3|nr:hypothetical protein CAOG_00367 [Capsaspora owczarzaki ATCC 30864]KJE88779.1 hypothetical protein CAOG_000367 [Capsaspora owczarzaki ATCC 30864]|eukprot:XP_004365238.2 hypothetical protein CAOG_00367 [Capsaspora owczarzaki ATCC 30864]
MDVLTFIPMTSTMAAAPLDPSLRFDPEQFNMQQQQQQQHSSTAPPMDSIPQLVARSEELQTQLYRMQSDLEYSQQQSERLRDELAQAEREISAKHANESRLMDKYNKTWDQLRSEKEEHSKLKTSMQSKEKEYQVEARRREREHLAVKDQLAKLQVDRKSNAKFGMEIVNAPKRVDISRPGARAQQVADQENEFHAFVQATFEERQRVLAEENATLRQALLTTHTFLAESVASFLPVIDELNEQVASAAKKNAKENGLDDSKVVTLAITPVPVAAFNQPMATGLPAIEKSAQAQMRAIADLLALLNQTRTLALQEAEQTRAERGVGGDSLANNLNESRIASLSNFDMQQRLAEHQTMHTATVAAMQEQMAQLETIIQQQDELLQQNVFQSEASGGDAVLLAAARMTNVSDSYLVEEHEELLDAKRRFEQERACFEQERKHYTDASIKLAKERELIQQERKTLERERSTMLDLQKTYTSCGSPSTPHRSRAPLTPVRGQSQYVTVATPGWLKDIRHEQARAVLF